MSINDFVGKHDLKSKATSNIKIQQVLSALSLDDVGIYLRDDPSKSDFGIVKIHPSKGSHWLCYINESCFDSYGVVCPKKLAKFIIKRNG